MRTYQYFSPGFSANVRLTYQDGLLIKMEADSYTGTFGMDKNAHFPINEQSFLDTSKHEKRPFIELERIITFAMMWKRYNHTPDKKLAEDFWNKMSKEKQIEAYDGYPRYEMQLKMSGLAKKYLVRYLKHEAWKNV